MAPSQHRPVVLERADRLMLVYIRGVAVEFPVAQPAPACDTISIGVLDPLRGRAE